MLTIYKAGLGTGGADELMRIIARRVEEGNRTLLFVPEQQTLTTERIACDMLPPTAPRCFEVTNFTRFANTAFRTLGGISGEYCDKTAKSLLMWRAVSELSGVLTMTRGKKSVTAGMVARAEAAVAEMQSLAILPRELSELADAGEIKDARLLAKLTDLAMIYSHYTALLAEHYNDITEDTLALADMISKNPEYLADTEIFVDGFTSFTEPQYRLLGEMVRHCHVTVALPLPKYDEGRFEFTELFSTERRLMTLADRAAVPKKYAYAPQNSENKPEILTRIADLLWSTGKKIDNETLQNTPDIGERVRIFSAETPFEECDLVAADIKRRVMAGERWRDFAIIAGNAESYSGILDLSLLRAGIPHFFSRVRDLSSFEAVKLIYTAYAMAERGFTREAVLTYMKCGLSSIEKADCDLFEEYVTTWGIEGSLFAKGDAWTMNPRGYEPFRDGDREVLNKIRATRELLITPISEFISASRAASTVREHATVLFSFLNASGVEEALHRRSLLLRSFGESARADENARLFGIICDALDRMVEVLGDAEAGCEAFLDQLTVTLSGTGFGSIPAFVDEVTVGSASMLRLAGKRHIYLIGVNDGEFPATVKDDSYFNERDKATLASLGLSTEPDLEIKGARELFSFTRAFSFATESVTLVYSRRSPSLAPILPSSVISKICELTEIHEIEDGKDECSVKRTVLPVRLETLGASDRLYFPDMAYELISDTSENERTAILRALGDTGEERPLSVSENNILNDNHTLDSEAIALIYNGDLYLSQSRLESYLECPFRYFLQYNLRLKDDTPAELSANLIGSFIHAILEDFFREANKREKSPSLLSTSERESIAREAAERFITSQLGSDATRARTAACISRLSRAAKPMIEGLCDEFSACQFRPLLFELSTDGKKPTDARPVVYELDGGERLIIRGKVDRVDTFADDGRVFVRVVDYKTGTKKFNPGDMARGINLQMFLYLKSIVETDTPEFRALLGAGENDELVPAGVIYAKTPVKDATICHFSDEEGMNSAKALSTREGMVLDDERSLGAMNPAFTPLAYPETKRNAESNAQRKYDSAGWSKICSDMQAAITDIAKDMRSGNVSAEPSRPKGNNPCSYCPYGAVCRKREV